MTLPVVTRTGGRDRFKRVADPDLRPHLPWRSFGAAAWNKNLAKYPKTRQTLTARYAKERDMKKLPVKLATGETIRLSPGAHRELIQAIIEGFAPRFVPGGVLIYAGDTGDKWGYSDKELLAKLGVLAPTWLIPVTQFIDTLGL